MAQRCTLRRATLAACLLLPALVGCQVPGREARVKAPKEPTASANRFIVQGPRISARSQAALDIRNAYGPVIVVVDDSIARPVVETRLLDVGPMTRAQLDSLYQGVTVDARSLMGDSRLILDAEVTSPPPPGARIEMTVRTPSCTGVIVRNANGGVELRGVSGEINVHSGVINGEPGGGIRLLTNQPIHGPVKMATTFGDIELFLPRASSGELELASLDGRVTVTADVGHFSGTRQQTHRLTTSMNGGKNLFLIETMSGDVYVRLDDRDWIKDGAWR